MGPRGAVVRLSGGGSKWHGLIVLDRRFADAAKQGNTLIATLRVTDHEERES